MDFLHNRFLVDYAQDIIYNLLQRTDGAPFLGEGEKYFSIIDDTEIEIIKCIWEHPDTYIKIPPARRIWNMELPELGDKVKSIDNPTYYAPSHSYKDIFINLTLNTLEALKRLEEVKDNSNVLVFDNMQRGSFLMLAIQIKNWDKVYFYKGFQKAFSTIQSHLAKFPEYEHYKDKLTFFDTKDNTCDISLIPQPAILISNRTPVITTEWIFPKPDNSDTIIEYIGRL